MSTGAIVMLLVGVIGLWGGLAVALVNYARRAKADTAGAEE